MRSILAALFILIAIDASAQTRGSQPLVPNGTSSRQDGLSQEDQQALQDTQELLRDRKQIEAYTSKDPTAKGADEQVKALLGPNTDQAYDLAADIFTDMVKQANGDPAKLMQLLQEAQRNPEKFANKLSPQHLQKLKSIASEVDKRSLASPPK